MYGKCKEDHLPLAFASPLINRKYKENNIFIFESILGDMTSEESDLKF